MKKKIAWGASKLLQLYLRNTQNNPFDWCIDDFSNQKEIRGMPIKKSDSLLKEKKNSFEIVIFAASNKSLREISSVLNGLGLNYSDDFIFYSDFFYDNFLRKVKKNLDFELSPKTYRFALSFTLNSQFLIHTTILGTCLFLEILNRLNDIKGSVAEIGAFEGGNALCGLQFMADLKPKKFYILDSFEGFAKPSKYDPKNIKRGDYSIETSFSRIRDLFSIFPQAKIVKGFIPQAFKQIPKNEKFSLVFYDCDLYQPALDTFNFFWDKIVPGGYLLIHDYEVEKGGFTGVRKATDEFFNSKKIKTLSFFENTMAVVKKQYYDYSGNRKTKI